ncbi:NAD(P)H-binding protein [Pantoea sp. SIMBA_079]|uniref:NAD(P)H-binding protein n=1 Tax=unclassified Pantoea TaxID=2630326 RepID=UPI0025D8A866|nr:NAD(P)H-binding protein [Pantoea sp. UBA4549]
MKDVFIVGGAGNIGRQLGQQLSQDGVTARALCRTAEQEASLQQQGIQTVRGDLVALDEQQLTGLMQGCGLVVFTAGAGGKGGEEMTKAVDGEGLIKSVAAAQRAGIKRFILVSAFPEAGRGRQLSDTFENYMRVKKQADVILAASALDWVIVRPGTLTDEPATGRISAGPAIAYGTIGRADVAATLAALVHQPAVSRVIIELTAGERPVTEAIDALITP